jgi:hypothetical protein
LRDEILNSPQEKLGVIADRPKHVIASSAQKATNLACRVAMIDVKDPLELIFFRGAANCTFAVLTGKQGIVIRQCDPVLSHEMPLASLPL